MKIIYIVSCCTVIFCLNCGYAGRYRETKVDSKGAVDSKELVIAPGENINGNEQDPAIEKTKNAQKMTTKNLQGNTTNTNISGNASTSAIADTGTNAANTNADASTNADTNTGVENANDTSEVIDVDVQFTDPDAQ